jgi:hypothetical protein
VQIVRYSSRAVYKERSHALLILRKGDEFCVVAHLPAALPHFRSVNLKMKWVKRA